MAETNDNWECLGEVILFRPNNDRYEHSRFFLNVKIIYDRQFYHAKTIEGEFFSSGETSVSKCIDNSRYNAFVDVRVVGKNGLALGPTRCYLNVPTWDKL